MGQKSERKQIGTVSCSACDFPRARVTEGTNGTLAISCSECGTGAFVKSPKAVSAMRAKLGAIAAPAADNQNGFAKFLGVGA